MKTKEKTNEKGFIYGKLWHNIIYDRETDLYKIYLITYIFLLLLGLSIIGGTLK